MKYSVFTTAFALAIAASQVDAQTLSSDSNSMSQSGSNSIVTFEGNSANVPGVNAPGIIHTSPCVVSASGGVSVAGFGISGGGGKVDENCVLLQQAAALQAVGGNQLAMNHLCQETSMNETMRVTGYQCPQRSDNAQATSRQSSNNNSRSVAYASCRFDEQQNAIRVRPASGASQEEAVSQCRQRLGM